MHVRAHRLIATLQKHPQVHKTSLGLRTSQPELQEGDKKGFALSILDTVARLARQRPQLGLYRCDHDLGLQPFYNLNVPGPFGCTESEDSFQLSRQA